MNNKKYFVIAAIGISFLLSLYTNNDLIRKFVVSISFPTIMLLILFDRVFTRNFINFDWKLSVNYISVIGISIGILSGIVIVAYITFPEMPTPLLNYLYYFFIILSIFSPICLILIPFSYLIVITSQFVRKKFVRQSASIQNKSITEEKDLKPRIKFFHLLLLILLSILISMIPHLDTINKGDQIIGVDTDNYSKWLELMTKSVGLEELLHSVFVTITGGDRALTLLLLYLLSSVFPQVNLPLFLEYLPILLGPMLILSTYFLSWGITKNHLVSILASLITIPLQVLIGVYGGLYANWFSLTWSYLAILFLFRTLDEPKLINYLAFSSLLVVLIFSHTPTWNILLYVIALFLAVNFFLKRGDSKKKYLYIAFSILPSVIADLMRLLLLDSSGIKQEIAFAVQREVGIQDLHTIWENLIATTHFTLGGQVGNPIILLLVVYWLFIVQIKERYTIFFIIFFSLFLLPFLFGDQQIQSRFFYEIPIQIPAAIALIQIKNRLGHYLPIAVCFWLIIMSAYMAANFVLIYH
ncbi:hypothetical protein [Candidatus Nitrosocosmicus franklandus]|uniref:hypothetical protein n=1 Tax=Candidatus Nitrosocosmicus franklandianus TaxID=1798806 RepID=UPI00106C6EDD|nr:hypothetical protein [Candidatus Nitrosocosmicus franklandus]